MAGYNWILNLASICVGHYFIEFNSKFESILTQSQSIIKILENRTFDFFHNFNGDKIAWIVDFLKLFQWG